MPWFGLLLFTYNETHHLAGCVSHNKCNWNNSGYLIYTIVMCILDLYMYSQVNHGPGLGFHKTEKVQPYFFRKNQQ